MVVFTITLLAVFLGLAFDYTSQTALFSRRGRDYTAAQAIANGALDAAFKRWQQFMVSNQAISASNGFGKAAQFNGAAGFTTSLQTALNSAVLSTGYQLTSLSINLVDRADNHQDGGITADTPSTGPMPNVPGWNAKTYSYQATASVQKISDQSMNVTVSRYFQESDASLFQAMLFFQDDLELHPGATMTLYGKIHTNSNLYAATSAKLTFSSGSNVSYYGNNSTLDPASNYHTANSNPNGHLGYIEGVTQTLYNTESSSWQSFNSPTYGDTIGSQLSQTQQLYPLGTDTAGAVDLNNPNASGTHEIIERPAPVSSTDPSANTAYTDPSAFAAHRIWNSAGVRILINRNSKTPVQVYVPNTVDGEGSAPAPTALTSAITSAITVNDPSLAVDPKNSTGDLYDMREGHAINVDTVDMSVLTPVFNQYSGYNGVVYISDITNADLKTGETSNTDAIRLKNGGVMPGADTNGTPNASGVEGLTIASDGGIYVQGDYNTGTTYKSLAGATIVDAQPAANTLGDPTQYTVSGYTQKPAAVMGDAVVILSNAWSDATSKIAANVKTPATATTFNAAIVSGQVPTTDSVESGGAHNFPRFLENWGGKNFTYHGSMDELYASKHFNGSYNSSANIYSAPNRLWYFDTSFLTNPPPGNLRTTIYGRGRWTRSNDANF